MDIAGNIKALRERVARALQRSGRAPEAVEILAVSKSAGPAAVEAARAAGLERFGENRVQEAGGKIQELAGRGIEWHFIGRIQENKIRKILDAFDVVQSFDRVGHLEKADACLAEGKGPKDVFLQINISREPQKGGFSYDAARRFFEEGGPARFPRLRIRGLMGIGPDTRDAGEIRKVFRAFRAAFDSLAPLHPPLKVLSMGMSGDFEIAAEEGATLVRIGTLIFGGRN